MIFKGELDINSGYKYQAEDATTMYEYHCDDHIRFQEKCNALPFKTCGLI